MSEARRQTRIIYDAFMEVVSNGRTMVRPSDVIELLRSRNLPLDIWYVTGQFSTLAAMKLIELDENSGRWKQITDLTFDEAVEQIEANDGNAVETSNG